MVRPESRLRKATAAAVVEEPGLVAQRPFGGGGRSGPVDRAGAPTLAPAPTTGAAAVLVPQLGATGGPTAAVAQSVTVEETVHSVRRMLERLPYYGVFDYIVFRVEGGTVYLAGYSFEGRLRADAERAARRARR